MFSKAVSGLGLFVVLFLVASSSAWAGHNPDLDRGEEVEYRAAVGDEPRMRWEQGRVVVRPEEQGSHTSVWRCNNRNGCDNLAGTEDTDEKIIKVAYNAFDTRTCHPSWVPSSRTLGAGGIANQANWSDKEWGNTRWLTTFASDCGHRSFGSWRDRGHSDPVFPGLQCDPTADAPDAHWQPYPDGLPLPKNGEKDENGDTKKLTITTGVADRPLLRPAAQTGEIARLFHPDNENPKLFHTVGTTNAIFPAVRGHSCGQWVAEDEDDEDEGEEEDRTPGDTCRLSGSGIPQSASGSKDFYVALPERTQTTREGTLVHTPVVLYRKNPDVGAPSSTVRWRA